MKEYSMNQGKKRLEFYITECLSPETLANGELVGVCFQSSADAFFNKKEKGGYRAISLDVRWSDGGGYTSRTFTTAERAFEAVLAVTREWKEFWTSVQESESNQEDTFVLLESLMDKKFNPES